MVDLVVQLSGNGNQPLIEFICLWTAFNNVYTTIADRLGLRPRVKRYSDGTPKTFREEDFVMVRVDPVREREKIDLAYNLFSENLKHELIVNESTKYFVYRTPTLNGHKIENDGLNQRLNGIINVGLSVDPKFPVYSRIDINLFEKYLNNSHDERARNTLGRQLVYVLYTIRNNIFHGDKRNDDTDDRDIVSHAVPLMSVIVSNFLNKHEDE
jgi:hypothetical protein